jgi:Domain of unknown function (DUF932)
MSFHNHTHTRIAKFGRNAVIVRGRNEPIDEATLRSVAPTLFATGKHSSRSERYSHIPTYEVLKALAKEGFDPWEVRVGGSGDEDKRAHTKHLIRLRRRGEGIVGGSYFETILRNAHDGTSAYALLAGFFKIVCSNGLVVSDGEMTELRVPHKGDVVHKVIEGTYTVLDNAPRAIEHVREMEGIRLTAPEQRIFAESAAMLRWAPDENGASTVPLRTEQLLYPRRHEDASNTLWDTFNRTEEALVNGGLHYSRHDAQGRLRHATTRPVRNIDGNVNLNRALWTLADRMRELKAA